MNMKDDQQGNKYLCDHMVYSMSLPCFGRGHIDTGRIETSVAQHLPQCVADHVLSCTALRLAGDAASFQVQFPAISTWLLALRSAFSLLHSTISCLRRLFRHHNYTPIHILSPAQSISFRP